MEILSIASITIFLAFLGIVATLLAPRLGRHSRIFTDVERVESAIPDSPAKDIRIEVYHNEGRVGLPIAVASILIENTGSKDITSADFVNPIEVRLQSSAQPVTLEIDAPDGAYPTYEFADENTLLRWAILKPREQIRVRLAFTYDPDAFDLRDHSKYIHVLARLKDVRTGEGLRTYAPLLGGLILAAIFSLSFLGVAVVEQFDEEGNSLAIRSTDSNNGKLIGGRSGIIIPIGPRYQICEPKAWPIQIAKCSKVDVNSYRKYIATSASSKKFPGLQPLELVMIGSIFVLYFFLGLVMFTRRRPRWMSALRLPPSPFVS